METCTKQCNDPDPNSSPPRSCLDASVGICSSSDEDRSEENSADFAALSNISGLPQNDESGVETPPGESPRKEEKVVDAICRRTRANFPLTDMSLDELETFLQESDEEDYFQNVDDEEEYRKFVAAVQGSLREGADIGSPHGSKQGGEEEDEDEDEEDDYDFEIELEEALDSDYDELPKQEVLKRKRRRQAATIERALKKRALAERPLGSARTPLRPLVPVTNDARKLFNKALRSGKRAVEFTPCQRRQLQCLIQEHVQLLVQVYSITVLDPAQQQIAADTQRLLLQLSDARAQMLSCKKPFQPEVCCCPQSAHSTMFSSSQPLVKLSAFRPRSPSQLVAKHLCPLNGAPETNADSNKFTSSNVYKGDGVEGVNQREHGEAFTETTQRSSDQATRKINSLLDISTLALVRDFLADIDKGLQDLRQQRMHASDSIDRPQMPLFPTSMIQVAPAQNCQRKKTMAGSLVEDTKLNGIILMPPEISAAMSRFIALFDSNLFPYKPPHAALAKRLLFTEAEDELLAMGLMRYNTNWEKIQQLLLPCKTTHQIFVRQKNRSTARAPENSIKAVRRLKTSPLTKEEEACIEEGLKYFRSDWRKVWEHCVPYRDPATLSRLWRAAVGLQKAHSASDEAKEKHRVGEKMRRRKQALLKEQNDGTIGDVNSGDETCEETASAYLHEAFLMDYNSHACSSPAPSNSISTLQANPSAQNLHKQVLNLPMPTGPCLPVLRSNPMPNIPSQGTLVTASVLRSNPMPNIPSRGTLVTASRMSRRAAKRHRRSSFQTIKLAPGLPSLNLPRCVRIISQAKYDSQFSGPGNSSFAPLSHGSFTGKKGAFLAASSSLAGLPPLLGTALSTGTSDCSSFCGGEKNAPAKMHPLLMQNTFDIGSTAPCTSSYHSSYAAMSGVPSTPIISRFRPFLPPSKDKSILGSKEVPAAATESTVRNAAELHPFLQDDGDYHQISSNIQTKTSLIDISTSSTSQMGNMHWPFLLADSVIRPEPRRAVRVQNGHHDCSVGVPINIQKVLAVSSHIDSRDHGKNGHGKDVADPTDMSQSSNLKKKDNDTFIKPCLEDSIFMEQEELSESEEETEEVVQFECEEITDSENDDSDCGKTALHPDKGEGGIHFEEEEIGSDDAESEVGM